MTLSVIKYRRADHVAWRRVGDETVVVHLDRKQMLGLNEAGSVVWSALEREHDLEAITRALGDHPDEATLRQVDAFLRDLGREGFVETEPAGTPLASEPAVLPAGAPAITWREELRAFGIGQCGFFPAGGGPCQGNPHQS